LLKNNNKFSNEWNPFNVLSNDAATVGNFDLDLIKEDNSLLENLENHKFDIVYYTGNSKWHKIIFALLRLTNNFKLYSLKNDKIYIIKFLSFFLKNYNVIDSLDFNLIVPTNVTSKFIKKISMYKKPWVFLSIDTSEDQIHIPKNNLDSMISKLKIKYGSIFINTSVKNESKIVFLKDMIIRINF
jgi:hypothetical protein